MMQLKMLRGRLGTFHYTVRICHRLLPQRDDLLSSLGFYIQHAGAANFMLMMLFSASYSFFINFPQYWLKWWIEAEPTSTELYMTGYILLTFMAWATTNGTAW